MFTVHTSATFVSTMSKRPKMLASVIREVIAPKLRECPQACGIVSITELIVSDDFTHATVYISAVREPERALQFFEDEKKEIQRLLGTLYRKRIPEVRFRVDERGEHGAHIEKLLEG